MKKSWTRTLIGLVILGSGATLCCAQEQGAADEVKTLRALLDGQQKQIDALNRRLSGPVFGNPVPAAPAISAPNGTSAAVVTNSGEGQVEANTPALDTSKKVGAFGIWDNHQLWFQTDNKDFRFHFGGRLQVDAVWTKASDRVQFGAGGTGKFEDAVNWRRLRLAADGWVYEVIDFNLEVDFVQTLNDDPALPPNAAINVINIPSLTDVWVAVNYIPWIGTIRIGNQKPPLLLEHLTSSRFLDFLERSPLFDINYHRNGGYEPGIEIANWTEDERLTWQLALFKNSQVLVPYVTGGGEYQVNGRVTFLPWYEDGGRYMIHLGLGVQYDDPQETVGTFLRERVLLRNGPPTTQNNVGLAILKGHSQFMAAPEFFMNLGPLCVQAEYLANHLSDITSFQTQSQGTVTVAGPPKSYFSQSAYVELMYFLTGEYRPYNKTPLHSNGAAPTRVVPLQNGWNPFTSGAWQAGVRYSYSDLTNNGIYGGQINEVTFGLNWFLNPNMKVQWNYDVGYRSQLGPGSSSNGTYQGFGTRLAFDF